MAWCPFAVRKPIAKARSKITPRAIITHTAVSGAASLYGYFSGVGDDSHFYVTPDGGLEQYVDTEQSAYANYNANSFAISIESADNKDPEHTPWNAAQLATIIRLVNWLASTHRTIARRQIESPTGSGIGWHAMWGAPSYWTTKKGKTCPAGPRIAQMKSTVIPAFIANKTAAGSAAVGSSAPNPTVEENHMHVPAGENEHISIPCNGLTRLFISSAFTQTVEVHQAVGIRDNGNGTPLGVPSLSKVGPLQAVNPDQPGPIAVDPDTRCIQLRYTAAHAFTAWCA